MAKPTPKAASAIFDLPRCNRRRPIDLLHISLLAFVDLAEAPLCFVPELRNLVAGFEAAAFNVAFDRIEERRAVTLRSRRPLVDVLQFQEAFAGFLTSKGFGFFGLPLPAPHVTINYSGDGQGSEEIAPIEWRVSEVLLIESVVGQTRHVSHGTIPLRQSR